MLKLIIKRSILWLVFGRPCKHFFVPMRGPTVRCVRRAGHWGQHCGKLHDEATFSWINRHVTRDIDEVFR